MQHASYVQDKAKFGDRQFWDYVHPDGRVIKCSAIRNLNIGGHWCAYVHTTFEEDKEYDVHGGITGGTADGGTGFDCAHYNDYMPLSPFHLSDDEHYWTFPEVKKETERLAAQL